jgi:cation transport ATPase
MKKQKTNKMKKQKTNKMEKQKTNKMEKQKTNKMEKQKTNKMEKQKTNNIIKYAVGLVGFVCALKIDAMAIDAVFNLPHNGSKLILVILISAVTAVSVGGFIFMLAVFVEVIIDSVKPDNNKPKWDSNKPKWDSVFNSNQLKPEL